MDGKVYLARQRNLLVIIITDPIILFILLLNFSHQFSPLTFTFINVYLYKK